MSASSRLASILDSPHFAIGYGMCACGGPDPCLAFDDAERALRNAPWLALVQAVEAAASHGFIIAEMRLAQHEQVVGMGRNDFEALVSALADLERSLETER
jgi:hypothetical protein